MVSAEDTTSPIEIATGRRLGWRSAARHDAETEPDAPRPREASPSVSSLIHQHTDQILQIARTEKPTTEQITALQMNVTALAKLADIGASFVNGSGGGGSGRGGAIGTLVAAAILSAGIALGVPGLTSRDDAATAKILVDGLSHRVEAIEVDVADREKRSRRERALTVRWLATEQHRQCLGIRAIAVGINSLVASTSKSKGDMVPIAVNCDQEEMPPELAALVAQSKIDDDD